MQKRYYIVCIDDAETMATDDIAIAMQFVDDYSYVVIDTADGTTVGDDLGTNVRDLDAENT